MFNNIELYVKLLSGEKLTDEENKKLRKSNIRYELVRFLYVEKMKADGLNLTDFHFSPGPKWEEVPIIDLVNELLQWNKAINNGDYEVVNFGDSSLKKSNPPHTGMKKVNLSKL